ncbi:protein of unknown function [Micromonospora nigra]|uniref:Uncharacterized protein n=1 Tax=Micromonospora nigra TaxID=145857 RepID=A0A1C6SCI7_9ACTN|nr:DUF4352 domain-containing protein [Micromonospora nigra]SCL27013.1 protein of unknown function [Micromonospora nigra]
MAVVVALLCCAGGVAALLVAGRAANEAAEALPTPGPARDAPGDAPTPRGGEPSRPATQGETFGMKPGDTLIIEDDKGTIEITVTSFRTVKEGCLSFSPKPKKGLYLIAEVTATITTGTSSINPFFFEWVADDGTTTNGLAGIFAGCGDPLSSGTNLRAGSKRAGTLAFDVTDDKGTLEYRHNFKTEGSWQP